MTTVSTDSDSAVDGRWVIFKPLIENFSEPLTPMTVDLLRRVLPPIGKFIHGWYYLNLERLQRFNPWKMSDAELAQVLLLRDRDIEAAWNWPGALRGISLLLLGYLSAGAFWSRATRVPAERLSAFAAHCESVLADPQLRSFECPAATHAQPTSIASDRRISAAGQHRKCTLFPVACAAQAAAEPARSRIRSIDACAVVQWRRRHDLPADGR